MLAISTHMNGLLALLSDNKTCAVEDCGFLTPRGFLSGTTEHFEPLSSGLQSFHLVFPRREAGDGREEPTIPQLS